MDLAKNVCFAFAASAGAGPAQGFELNETFLPILPLDGQLFADDLQILRSHASI